MLAKHRDSLYSGCGPRMLPCSDLSQESNQEKIQLKCYCENKTERQKLNFAKYEEHTKHF